MKFTQLMKLLEDYNKELQDLYGSELNRINKQLFNNKEKISLSVKGLFKFKGIINMFITSAAFRAGIASFDTQDEMNEMQKIITGITMLDADDNKNMTMYINKSDALDIWEGQHLMKKSLACLSKSRKNDHDANLLITDSFVLSFKNLDKKKIKLIENFYYSKTTELIKKYT
jgi:hypothetical protein